MNTLHLADGYKVDHRRQYPEGPGLVYSNWTPRKSRLDDVGGVVFFGLQYFIKKYLVEDFDQRFFGRPKAEVASEYRRRISAYLGPDAVTYEHVDANGEGREIFKSPKTDDGTKKSAKGLIAIEGSNNRVTGMKDSVSYEEEKTGLLKTVYKDGKLLEETTL